MQFPFDERHERFFILHIKWILCRFVYRFHLNIDFLSSRMFFSQKKLQSASCQSRHTCGSLHFTWCESTRHRWNRMINVNKKITKEREERFRKNLSKKKLFFSLLRYSLSSVLKYDNLQKNQSIDVKILFSNRKHCLLSLQVQSKIIISKLKQCICCI